MPNPTYEIKIDTLRNGLFAGSIDDVSGYAIKVYWNNGMDSPYQDYAPAAKLTLILNNEDDRFGFDSLGSEEIANGSFATWSGGNPSSWTVSGESGSDPEISQVSPTRVHGAGGTGACNIYASSTSATVSIAQTTLVVGRSYKATFKITARNAFSYSGGGIQLYSGSTAVSPILNAVGEHTYYFTAVSTSFKIQNYRACNVTIDDVSVKEVNIYGPFLRNGTLLRVRAIDPTTTTTHQLFIGPIVKVNPEPGERSERKLKIEVEDLQRSMYQETFNPELLTNVRIDTAIQSLFDSAILAIPYAHTYAMVGVVGSCEIGTTAILYEHAATEFDESETVLPYTGDVDPGSGGMDIQNFIRDLVSAEAGGRFFFNGRTGKFTFHNRNRDLLNTTIWASLTSADLLNADYAVHDDLVNVCTITMKPRELGAAGTVVWEETNLPKTLQPGEEYRVTANFKDPDNPDASVSVIDGIKPVFSVDYIAQNAGGNNVFQRAPLTVKFNGRSADVHILNVPYGGPRASIITKLQLRGTPIYTYNDVQVTAKNPASIARHTKKVRPLNLRALSDEDFAYQYALYQVNRFSEPIARYNTAQFMANHSSTLLTKALSLTIGNIVNITNSYTGHDQDYVIVGEQHEVAINAQGLREHKTKWVLKLTDREPFLVIGTTGRNVIGTNKLGL